MRFIFPIILLIISGLVFSMYTNPWYKEVKAMRAEASSYDSALSNSYLLQKERDSLSEKYNSLSPEAIERLSKLLPDNADNIRLVIDIQRMAQSYGLSVGSIKFDTGKNGTVATPNPRSTPDDIAAATKDYGVVHMDFSTTATYPNFLKFLRDVETSLRLVDVESVDFTAGDKDTTTYTVKLKTYWLKNS